MTRAEPGPHGLRHTTRPRTAGCAVGGSVEFSPSPHHVTSHCTGGVIGERMLLKILGPLELVANGKPVPLGGPRQRAVLAVLALNANRVTSVDQLVHATW